MVIASYTGNATCTPSTCSTFESCYSEDLANWMTGIQTPLVFDQPLPIETIGSTRYILYKYWQSFI